MSDLLKQKLEFITARSVEGLDAVDLAERLQWNSANGRSDAQVFDDEDGVTVLWGGRRLAIIDREFLADDVALEELTNVFVPESFGEQTP